MPDKFIVLKLFEASSGEKLFVNLLSHPAIEPPDERALLDYEEQTGIRVPLSMSSLRE